MKGKRKPSSPTPNTPSFTDAMEEVLAPEENAAAEELKLKEISDHDINDEPRDDGDEGDGEEEYEDDEFEEEDEKAEGDDEDEERPKLDEGFFEIEAIRRKRVRKGQLQYLIKWRGWPETANTWEPLENLQACCDVIDAFEESLRSGRSTRKRKRKYGGTTTQLKKKQPPIAFGYNMTGVEINFDEPLSSTPLDNLSLASPSTGSGRDGENNVDASNGKMAKKVDENWYTNGSKQASAKKEDTEYDPKLSELRGTMSTNDVNADKIAVHFQEGNASRGNDSANGLHKVDYADPVQNSRRTGAKRRKSGSVKRFKKDLDMCESLCLQNSPFFFQSSPLDVSVGSDGALPVRTQNGGFEGPNSSCKPAFVNSSTITKILKPVGFSASVVDNIQNVVVTFLVLRSDGKEVMVDNRFLKANNPHLLIDFYEQHLKYSST